MLRAKHVSLEKSNENPMFMGIWSSIVYIDKHYKFQGWNFLRGEAVIAQPQSYLFI